MNVWGCRSALLLVLVTHALILFGVGTFYGPLDWRASAALSTLQWVGALVGAKILICDSAVRRRIGAPLLWFGGALVAWVLMAPVYATLPRFALPAYLGVPGALGWAIVATAVIGCSPRHRRATVLYLALAGLGLALWSYVEFRRGVTVRPALPLGHHNFLAGCLILCLGPSLALAFSSPRLVPRVVGGLAGFTMVMTLAGTSSLSATAGLFGGVACALLLGGKPLFESIRGIRGGRTAALISAPAVILVLMVLTPGGPRIALRSMSIVSGQGDTSLRNRGDYVRGAIRGMMHERALAGVGPGNTPVVFPAHRIQRDELEEVGKVVPQLHSTPAHVLYELGVPGLALATGMVLAMGWRLIGAWYRRSPRRPSTILGLGACAGLAAYAVSCLGDFQLHVAGVPATIALVLGLGLSGTSGVGRADPLRASRILAVLMAVVATRGGLGAFDSLRAHRAWDQANVLADQRIFDLAIESAERAIALDPDLGFYQNQLGLLLLEAGRDDETGRIAELLVEAARRTPCAPLFSLQAAEALLAEGRLEESRPFFRLGAALDLASPLPWYFWGELERRLGNERKSLLLHQRAILVDPRLIGASVYRLPEFDPLRDELVQSLLLPAEFEARARRMPDWLKGRRADAILETSYDSDPWRSRSTFVFRRQGRGGGSLGVSIATTGTFGRLVYHLVQAGVRFPGSGDRIPGPLLPKQAIEILGRSGWAEARRLREGPRPTP